MASTERSVREQETAHGPGDRSAVMRARALEERRVAPERVRMLVELEEGLHGRLRRRPLLCGTLIAAGVFVATYVLGALLGAALAGALGQDDLRSSARTLGINLVGAGCVAGLLWRLGWWRQVGFAGPSTWRSLPLLAIPAVIAAVSLVGGLVSLDSSDPARLALRLPEVLLTGFWEEGLTRGVLLSLLLAAALRGGRRPVGAVVTAAAIFGLLHLVNAVGAPLSQVLVQVVYATLIGIGFGALLLRTNALWLLVILHALFNSGSALQGANVGGSVGAVIVLSTLPLAVYGLFLLRRVKRGEQAVVG